VTGYWFSQVCSTNKTDCRDITEILLKVVLKTINHNHKKEWKHLKLSYQLINIEEHFMEKILLDQVNWKSHSSSVGWFAVFQCLYARAYS
jgi:hypothetical protein